MGRVCPSEPEEVPMPIAGGLDIHRKQLTFDYLDTVTGEVRRGQFAPADREHLRAWLARFAGRDDVACAMEGCTGWRYVAEDLAAAGIAAHVGERPAPPPPAAASGTPRPARPIRGTCGRCWPRAGCRSAGSRRRRSWSSGRCWRPITTCAASTLPGPAVRCSSTGRPGAGRGRAAHRAGRPDGARPPLLTCRRARDGGVQAERRGPAGRVVDLIGPFPQALP